MNRTGSCTAPREAKSKEAKKRIKAREQSRKGDKAPPPEEPF